MRPEDIYNCDETILDLNKSTQRVVVPGKFKSAHSRLIASTEHINIHCCISASGAALPPMIIFKNCFPGGPYSRGGPDGALYAHQKSGFMDQEIFVSWFKKNIHCKGQATTKPCEHPSHCSTELTDVAPENNVLPTQLTYVSLVMYLSSRACRQSSLNSSRQRTLQGNLFVSKRNVPRMIIDQDAI